MNNGVPLDVFKIVERLEGGGVPPEQAKVQATVLSDVISEERKRVDARYLPRQDLACELLPIKSSIEKVDAKIDLLAIESRASAERLELRIYKSVGDVKNEIMRWMLSLWFLQVGLVATLLFTLPG